jgi:moderate conductance mechanosensitive channel
LTFAETTAHVTSKLGPIRGLVIIVAACAAAYVASRLIDLSTPRLTKLIGYFSDRSQSSQRVWRSRRLETFVGTIAAVLRVVAVGICLLVGWHFLSPTSSSATLIGASAVMAIVVGSVLSPLFRDITFGSMMIAEDWYNVGDHIIVVPFDDVRGIVEKLTPRSTKIRSLNGEVIWMHNQNIMGARVTSRGVRTIALDVFVNDDAAGKRVIQQAIRTVPTGPTMLAGPLKVGDVERLSDELWRISAVGQTMPGREWLIEDFAVNAIKKYDALSDDGPVIVHGPIAHHADATAERKFRRVVRASDYGSAIT